MAKLNAPKAFDKSLLDQDLSEKLEPLLGHVNQNFDQLIRALYNQLTLSENVNGTLVTVSAYNNVQTFVQTGGKAIAGILPIRVSGDGLAAMSWYTDNSGRIAITFKFSDPQEIQTRSCTFSSSFGTYEVNRTSNISIGDVISVTGFGNANNNGTFVVLQKTASSVVVYNSLGATESKSSYTGTSEAAKQVNLFILY